MNIRVHLQGLMGLICGLALLGSFVHTQKCEAATYYVATDGSDTNSGTEEQPFQTLSRGIQNLGPGDTLFVKNGTYTSWGLYGPPRGTSWDNPVTIAAYPGHSPVIVNPDQFPHVLEFANTRYIILDGFFIDGTNSVGEGVKITNDSSGMADHIRIQNSEIAYVQQGSGIVMTSGSDGNEFINLHIHANGVYGIYITSSNNLIENCSIYDNAGWGVHLYNSRGGVNNNIIRNNTIYDNGSSGMGDGVIVTSGSGNQVYNNNIWGNVGGIRADYGASNTYIANNTIHENPSFGISIGVGSRNALIEANNIYDTNGQAIEDYGAGTLMLP